MKFKFEKKKFKDQDDQYKKKKKPRDEYKRIRKDGYKEFEEKWFDE